MGKYFDETLAHGKRLMRMSLVALLNDQVHKYSFHPMYGERYRRFLDQIRDLGIEEITQAQAPPGIDVSSDVERGSIDQPDGE